MTVECYSFHLLNIDLFMAHYSSIDESLEFKDLFIQEKKIEEHKSQW